MSETERSDKYNCAEVKQKVQAYIDGQLTSEEALLFEDHLDYCLPCDKKVEFETKFKTFLRLKAAAEPCPESLKLELNKIVHDD